MVGDNLFGNGILSFFLKGFIMRPTYINSTTDIRTYVSAGFGSSSPSCEEINEIVETIQFMDHPAYGQDWGEFLRSLPDYYDLIEIEMND